MPYYHVVSPALKRVCQDVKSQTEEQAKKIRSLRRKLNISGVYLGVLGDVAGVEAKDPKKFDPNVWCKADRNNPKHLRPRSTSKAKEVRALLAEVPIVDYVAFRKALKFEVVLHNGRMLSRPSLGWSKTPLRFVVYYPEWAIDQVKIPAGLKEITHEKIKKWGLSE